MTDVVSSLRLLRPLHRRGSLVPVSRYGGGRGDGVSLPATIARVVGFSPWVPSCDVCGLLPAVVLVATLSFCLATSILCLWRCLAHGPDTRLQA
jgi:hypothetical protein